MKNTKKKLLTLTAVAAAAATAVIILAPSGFGAPVGRSESGHGGKADACVAATQPSQPTQTSQPGQPDQPGQQPPPPQLTATTVSTIGQAYNCIFENYFDGPNIEDRTLLVAAFAGLTQELQRRGVDQGIATMPALTGRRDADWQAFAAVYQQIDAHLPADPAVHQAVAEATMHGMVDSLRQNHVDWGRIPVMQLPTAGITVSGGNGPGAVDPAAVAPLFVKALEDGGAAADAGIKAGDEITSINGAAPFINGRIVKEIVLQLTQPANADPIRLTLRRPTDGKTYDVTVTPRHLSGKQPAVESRVLNGNIGYVKLSGFYTGAADQVVAAVADLRKHADLRGLILDLRGNGGGSPTERARLAGAFVHGKTTDYTCDQHDHCTPNVTDDSVPLINLPLSVLVDRDCASACDSFAAAAKDLHLGSLVGTRTAGVVSGEPHPYNLNDGSAIVMPPRYEIGADHEFVNGIGVAPDYELPVTADTLARGQDVDVDKALELLPH